MSLQRIRSILAVILLLVSISIALPISLLSWRLNGFLDEKRLNKLEASADKTGVATRKGINDSARSVRAIEKLLTESVAPAIKGMQTDFHDGMTDLRAQMREIGPVLREARKTIETGGTLISNVDTRLLPEITATAQQLKTTPDAINRAVNELVGKYGLAMEEIISLMREPAWKQAIQEAARATTALTEAAENVQSMTFELRESAKYAPSIAANVERLSKTTSKLAKISILASIVATLAKAFLPF